MVLLTRGQARAGVAYQLTAPSPVTRSLAVSNGTVELKEDCRYIVARLSIPANEQQATAEGRSACLEALDLLSIVGRVDLALSGYTQLRFVWWSDSRGAVLLIAES